MLSRQVHNCICSFNAFSHRFHRVDNLIELAAVRQGDADGPIAALIARAGQDQISKASQTRHSLHTPAHCPDQSRYFG